MISINMNIAKSIWKDQLRLFRGPALEKLDVAYIRAIENNDIVKQQEIINKKQILRDCPADPRIEAAESPEELININPIKELGL